MGLQRAGHSFRAERGTKTETVELELGIEEIKANRVGVRGAQSSPWGPSSTALGGGQRMGLGDSAVSGEQVPGQSRVREQVPSR